MPSIFSKIISGEIPCYKVSENENFLAFLDIQPLKEGHVLVIPKVCEDDFFELEDEILSQMIIFSKQVSKKIKKSFPCKKVGVTVIGLEVPHAHIHLLPINSMDDMNFANPKLNLSKERLKEICDLLNN